MNISKFTQKSIQAVQDLAMQMIRPMPLRIPMTMMRMTMV